MIQKHKTGACFAFAIILLLSLESNGAGGFERKNFVPDHEHGDDLDMPPLVPELDMPPLNDAENLDIGPDAEVVFAPENNNDVAGERLDPFWDVRGQDLR
jgi:hypothetical protein